MRDNETEMAWLQAGTAGVLTDGMAACEGCRETLVLVEQKFCKPCAQFNVEIEAKRLTHVEAQAEELRNEVRRASLFSERLANMDRAAYMKGRGENFDAEYAFYCPDEIGEAGGAVKEPFRVTASVVAIAVMVCLLGGVLLTELFKALAWLVVSAAAWAGR